MKIPSANRKNLAVAAGIALIIIAVTLVLVFWPSGPNETSNLIGQLPKKSPQHPPIYLANKNQPAPTDSWFSGLVFRRPSTPVYAYPWAFATGNNSASLGYPSVKSTPNTVFADDVSDLKLSFNSDQALVTNFNKMSVNLAYFNGNQNVASARITQGSPYVYFTLAPHQTATLAASGQMSKAASDQYIIKLPNKTYGIWTSKNANVDINASGAKISTNDKPASFTLIALANLNQSEAFNLAANPLSAASASYQISGNKITTTFTLTTKNHQPTLFGLMPRQYSHMPKFASDSQVATLQGEQKFARGNSFSYTITSQIPSGKIITGKLTSTQTSKLNQLLENDASSLKFDQPNDYFAFKQLYKTANLLEIARELGQSKIASQIQNQLSAQLNMWLDPSGCKHRDSKCFYYDPEIRGLVAEPASFGSEHFNDHNFHYGYLIYAASVLARYDNDFIDRHGPMVNLIIDDIASSSAGQNFPKLRGFDPYAGHSWADGYGLFADGNNQESSSEAVNAWYAIYLWARVTNDQKLEDLATWLYANETNTALADYTNVPLAADSRFTSYQHPIVSLVWGGKLDYATFFSNSPAAKLGIQLIPMSPGATYFASDPGRINQNLASLSQNPSQFKDYFLMYQALADPKAASASLANIKPSDIDGADSLTYLTAWIDSH